MWLALFGIEIAPASDVPRTTANKRKAPEGSSRDPVALAILRPHLGRSRIRRDVYKSPLPSSFLRMTVGRRGMFVRELAMFDGRSRVLLRLFVLAEIVMMGRLMVMVRCSVVVSGRLMVMLTHSHGRRYEGIACAPCADNRRST